jgi:hypothetical protein
MSTVRDMGGYWMARCSIEPPKTADEDTSAELFIAGPPDGDSPAEGILVLGFAAIVALRDCLTDEIETYTERVALESQDIPQ